METELSTKLAREFTSPPSVDNLVNKPLDLRGDAANSARIHRLAYFLGIRPLSD